MKKISLKIDGKEIEVSKEELLSMLSDDKETKKETKETKETKEVKPLRPFGQRKLRYINPHGKEVWLAEEQAFGFHTQMKEFLGDQDGNMTPPRDMRRTFHNANGSLLGTSLPR